MSAYQVFCRNILTNIKLTTWQLSANHLDDLLKKGIVVIRNFAPPKFRKVKPPTKNTINKECKCGKNREAFINFVVETKK